MRIRSGLLAVALLVVGIGGDAWSRSDTPITRTIRGRTEDAFDNSPIRGATAHLMDADREVGSSATDLHGEFSVRGAGAHLHLRITAVGWRQEDVLVPGHDRPVIIDMVSGARISGTI